jgi:hypothetical protein
MSEIDLIAQSALLIAMGIAAAVFTLMTIEDAQGE